MKNIVVLGSANVDYVVQVQRLPSPGQTVNGSDLVTTFGGKGANVAVAAARLGGAVQFVGCLGNDAPGGEYLAHLKREKIDTEHVRRLDRPTGSAMILLEQGGQNMIAVAPGANGAMQVSDVEAAAPAIRAAGVLLCQFEVPLPCVQEAIGIANAAGVPVVLNPSPMHLEFPWNSVRVNYLIVNEGEAEQLLGSAEPGTTKFAEAAKARGFSNVLVTRGAEPTICVRAAGESITALAFPVESVDTVGAGDTFAGAFTVALAEQQDLESALRFANASAAIAVTRLGAQTSMPLRGAVEEMLRKG